MPKNILICSDGTGNTFSQQRSNISSLIRLVKLSEAKEQVVLYDQGLGTNPKLVANAKAYQSERDANRPGLAILPLP
jgi:uncharacterized protein (DUF2235 family)